MSVTVQQILGLLQTLAPSELACSWDNVGLLVDVGVPCGISGRTVHFRWIFPGESTSPVGSFAPVGVNDNFSSS